MVCRWWIKSTDLSKRMGLGSVCTMPGTNIREKMRSQTTPELSSNMPLILLFELITGALIEFYLQKLNILSRKSAAWSRDSNDDFLEFGDSMYSDASQGQKTVSAANTVTYGRNRVKITNPKVSENSKICI